MRLEELEDYSSRLELIVSELWAQLDFLQQLKKDIDKKIEDVKEMWHE